MSNKRTQVLNELLEISRSEDPESRDVLRMLGPDDIGPTASETSNVNQPTIPPVSTPPSENFVGWSTDDIYAFWRQYVRAKDDIVENRYTAFTFLVADEQTASNKTVLLCSDAPDWGEGEHDVVLKEVRMGFRDAAIDVASFEYLSMTPSEWGKGKGLIVNPNPWMKVVELETGQRAMVFSTPEFARARKRQALMDASVNGTVDMTRAGEGPASDQPRRFHNVDEALQD